MMISHNYSKFEFGRLPRSDCAKDNQSTPFGITMLPRNNVSKCCGLLIENEEA
jgi:hypothetical protein